MKQPGYPSVARLFLSCSFLQALLPLSNPVLRAVSFYLWQILLELHIRRQVLEHLGQGYDANYRYTEIALYFLYGRQFALAALFAVERNQHTGRPGILRLDDLHDFTDGRTSRNDIVNDQDSPGQRRSNQGSTFAMSLGFLAIETPGEVAPMLFIHGDGNRCRQWNTFVGRAEQHIELQIAVCQRGRIEAPEPCQRRAGVEQSGIEKVRTGAARFKGELAEAQDAALDGEADELALIFLHENSSEIHGSSDIYCVGYDTR